MPQTWQTLTSPYFCPVEGEEDWLNSSDLRHPKGSFASRSRIFSRSSSISMVCSPIFSLRRLIRPPRPESVFLRPSASTGRKASLHCERCLAAVTPSSRLSVSMSSPRRSRRTASVLCCAQNRLGAAFVSPVPVALRPPSTGETPKYPCRLFAHESPHGESLYSQFGVQENPIPRTTFLIKTGSLSLT
jgi:hypothetical protein